MPPKTILMKPIKKCIKFGEILIDENKKVFILCMQCFMDFVNLQQFTQHIKDCKNSQNIIGLHNSTKLNCEKGTVLISRVKNNGNELLIYDVNKKKSDGKPCKNKESTNLLNIQEELLNPRWYTDLPFNDDSEIITNQQSKTSYNDLIEEVTPFVQFKENVKTKRNEMKSNHISKPTGTRLQSQQKLQAIAATTATTAPHKEQRKPLPPKTLRLEKNEIINSSTNNRKTILKRKATSLSLPDPKITPSESEQTAKRRKTTGQIQNPPNPQSIQNLQNMKTTKSTLVLPSNNVERNLNSQINKPTTRTTRRETLNSRQLQPQSVEPVRLSPRISTITLANTKRDSTNSAISNKTSHQQKQHHQQQQQQQPTSQIFTTIHEMPTKAINTNSSINSCLPANNQQTVEILNKLQTLGLKVQRTNPPPPPPKQTSITNNSNEKALEIIKKLQSKGMHVKLVQKNNQLPETSKATKPIPMQQTTACGSAKIINGTTTSSTSAITSTAYMSPSALKRSASVANSVLASKPNFRKNVLIKKFN